VTEAEKPTLMQTRRQHKLTTRQVAELANVPLRIVYLMEIGGVVERDDGEKVIRALSSFTKHSYTIDDFSGINIQIVKTSPTPKRMWQE
jgi:hypothetical protein